MKIQNMVKLQKSEESKICVLAESCARRRTCGVLRKRCQWGCESAAEKLLIKQCKDGAAKVNVIFKDIKTPKTQM